MDLSVLAGATSVAALALAVVALVRLSSAREDRLRSRRPGRSVLVGWGTAVATAAMLTAMTWQAVTQRSWNAAHAWLLLLAVVTLLAVAVEWPALALRAVTGGVIALLALAALTAGWSEVPRDRMRELRSTVTALDAELARSAPTALGRPDQTPPTSQQGQLVSACRTAFGVLVSDAATAHACTSDEVRRPGAADLRSAAVAVSRARVAVREHALLLTDDTGRAAALAALAAAQEEAGAAAQDRAAGTGERVSVARAFTAGVEAVRLPGGTGGRIPLVPEEVGWALALLAALTGYRLLEVLNSRLDAGPVEIVDPEASPEVSILRHHLLRNVPEPGSQPGSSASSSITDLVERVAPNKLLQALITAANTVGFPPRGYRVTLSLLQPPADAPVGAPGGAPGVEALVTITSRRTRIALHTVVERADTKEDAIARAAYACAAWILARARGVPPWLKWDPASASAWWEANDLSSRTSGRERVLAWEKVVSCAPDSAQALVALGNEYDLASRRVEAFRCYDRAHALYVDYRVAAYRRAISLYVLARRWDTLDGGVQQELVAALEDHGCTTADPATELPWLADRLLGELGRWPRWKWLTARLNCRQRGNGFSSLRAAVRASDIAITASCVAVRHVSPAYDRSRVWQVQYNLACAATAAAQQCAPQEREEQLDRALRRLGQALSSPGSSGSSAEWTCVDPDLELLRTRRRMQFDAVVRRMPAGRA